MPGPLAECRPLLKATNEFIDHEEQQGRVRVEQAEAAYNRERIVMLLVCVAAVVPPCCWAGH